MKPLHLEKQIAGRETGFAGRETGFITDMVRESVQSISMQ